MEDGNPSSGQEDESQRQDRWKWAPLREFDFLDDKRSIRYLF